MVEHVNGHGPDHDHRLQVEFDDSEYPFIKATGTVPSGQTIVYTFDGHTHPVWMLSIAIGFLNLMVQFVEDSDALDNVDGKGREDCLRMVRAVREMTASLEDA